MTMLNAYTMDDLPLAKVSGTLDLGVLLDEKFIYNNHIQMWQAAPIK